MGSDGLAVLVLLGFGGLVLWYLTKPPTKPVAPPCSSAGTLLGGLSVGGVKIGSCADPVIGTVGEFVHTFPTMVTNALDPLGFFGEKPIGYAEAEAWRRKIRAQGAVPPGGCGGWKGACPPSPQQTSGALANEPSNYIPVGKPPGFR